MGGRGAGRVVRNTADRIATRIQAQSYRARKIIIMETVVEPKKDSRKKTIALEVIQDTVRRDGRKIPESNPKI